MGPDPELGGFCVASLNGGMISLHLKVLESLGCFALSLLARGVTDQPDEA